MSEEILEQNEDQNEEEKTKKGPVLVEAPADATDDTDDGTPTPGH